MLEDADCQPIWETVIGIRDAVSAAPRGSRDLRRWLESFDGLVEPVLTSASHALLSSLQSDASRTAVSRHPARDRHRRGARTAARPAGELAAAAGPLRPPRRAGGRRPERDARRSARPLHASACRARQRRPDLGRSTAAGIRRDPPMIPGVRGGLISASFARDLLPSCPRPSPCRRPIAAKLASWSRRVETTLGTASSVRAITDVAVLPLLDLLGLSVEQRIDRDELPCFTSPPTPRR